MSNCLCPGSSLGDPNYQTQDGGWCGLCADPILGLGASPSLPEIGSRPRSLLLCLYPRGPSPMHSSSSPVHDLVRCILWNRFSLVTVYPPPCFSRGENESRVERTEIQVTILNILHIYKNIISDLCGEYLMF